MDEFLGPLPIKNATNSRRSTPYTKPKVPDVSGIIEFRVPDSAITNTSKIVDEVKMLSGSSHVPSASVKVTKNGTVIPVPTSFAKMKGTKIVAKEGAPLASYHTAAPPFVARGNVIIQQYVDPLVNEGDEGLKIDEGFECFFDADVVEAYTKKGVSKRGRKALPLVGDRGIVFKNLQWSLSYRRYIAAMVESFNKFFEMRGVSYPGTFTPGDIYAYCLARQREMKTTADNIASVFSVITNFLAMNNRLQAADWGERMLNNYKGYLKAYSRKCNWQATKAGVIGMNSLRSLLPHEKLLATLFIQSAYRDASIETIWQDDIWVETCPWTREPAVFVNVCKAKTWPAYIATGGHHGVRTTGIVSLLCNCCPEYGHEWCVLCHGRWKALSQMMPLPAGMMSAILAKINRTVHGMRRTAATMAAIADSLDELDPLRWNSHFFWSPSSKQRFNYALDFRSLTQFAFMPSRAFTYAMRPSNDAIKNLDLKNEERIGRVEYLQGNEKKRVGHLEDEQKSTKDKIDFIETQLAAIQDAPKENERQIVVVEERQQEKDEVRQREEEMRKEMADLVQAVMVMKVEILSATSLHGMQSANSEVVPLDQGERGLEHDHKKGEQRRREAKAILDKEAEVVFTNLKTTAEDMDKIYDAPSVKNLNAVIRRFL